MSVAQERKGVRLHGAYMEMYDVQKTAEGIAWLLEHTDGVGPNGVQIDIDMDAYIAGWEEYLARLLPNLLQGIIPPTEIGLSAHDMMPETRRQISDIIGRTVPCYDWEIYGLLPSPFHGERGRLPRGEVPSKILRIYGLSKRRLQGLAQAVGQEAHDEKQAKHREKRRASSSAFQDVESKKALNTTDADPRAYDRLYESMYDDTRKRRLTPVDKNGGVMLRESVAARLDEQMPEEDVDAIINEVRERIPEETFCYEQCVRQGRPEAEVAAEMGLSQKTVNSHKRVAQGWINGFLLSTERKTRGA